MNAGAEDHTNTAQKGLGAPVPHIPDLELLRPIAAGSYGEVWLARNIVGTLRAVKIVRRDRFERAEEFDREFKGLQNFEPISRAHEGLVDIPTLGLLPDGAGIYYVMELADDGSESRLQPASLESRLQAVSCDQSALASGPAKAGTPSEDRLKAELVRLKWCWDRAVEVRLLAVKKREGSNRNCVGVIRGGEQWNENGQSVTTSAQAGGQSELDSVGGHGLAP